MGTLESIIIDLALNYPWVTLVLSVVGLLRLINKPLFAALHAYVMTTPSKNDEILLEKVEKSQAYRWLTFALDWVGSVKVPRK